MKERYLTLDENIVWWIEVERFYNNRPVYKVESGWYLGTYAFATHVRHICTTGLTSCVVRHIDPSCLFTDKEKALEVMEKWNNESMENS